LKAKVASLEADLGTANATAEAAQQEVQRIKLDEPLAECLGDMFSVRLKYVMPEIQEKFAFSLSDEGIKFTQANGDPVMIGDREAEFNPADIRKALEQVGGFDGVLLSEMKSGGGKQPSSSARSIEDKTAPHAPRQQFGLR
jgi:hypothetical protein